MTASHGHLRRLQAALRGALRRQEVLRIRDAREATRGWMVPVVLERDAAPVFAVVHARDQTRLGPGLRPVVVALGPRLKQEILLRKPLHTGRPGVPAADRILGVGSRP